MTAHLDTPALGAAISIFTILAVVFGGLRLYIRRFMVRSVGWDDGFLVIALAFAIAGYGILLALLVACEGTDKKFYGKRYGKTHYFTTKKATAYNAWLNLNEAGMATYTLQNMFSRLALLFTYRRFTPRDRKNRRRCINFFVILTVIVGVGFSFIEIFPCYPPHVMYYPNDIKGYYCVTPRQPFWWGSVFGVVLDGGMYILPFWLLWRADIASEYKRALYGMFAFGLFVMIVSIVRLPLIGVLKKYTWLPTAPKIVFNQIMWTWLWTTLESSCLIIAVALPTFRPLIRATKDRWGKGSAQRLHSEAGSGAPVSGLDFNRRQNDLEHSGWGSNEKAKMQTAHSNGQI